MRTQHPDDQRLDEAPDEAPDEQSRAEKTRGDPRPWDTTTGRIGIAALAVAIVALAMSALQVGLAATNACDAQAWDAVPAEGSLPAGWTVAETQVSNEALELSFDGPSAAEGGAATAFATVSCHGTTASAFVDRSSRAAEAAGQSPIEIGLLGDQRWATRSSDFTTTKITFRRGGIVTQLEGSTSIDLAVLEEIARAIDAAITGADHVPASIEASGSGVAIASPSASASASVSTSASAEPSPAPSQAAPELVGLLPNEIDGQAMTINSATGETLLGADDAQSRAVRSGLATLGRADTDLEVAQAYDATRQLDMFLLAFRLADSQPGELAELIERVWLLTGSPGVVREVQTLGGKQVTVVSYEDELNDQYVYSFEDAVFLIDAGDATVAEQVVAALP
jgi:hypothetical protein